MMTATYTCNTGYTHIIGEDTQTCGANKVWTPEAPTCAREKHNDCVHCIHCVHIPQLLTVVPSLFLMGKSTQPPETSLRAKLPIPVMMATLSMEHQLESVKLMEPGA